MKFQKRYGKRKRSNPKRGIMLVILLFLVIILWFNADTLIAKLF